MSFGNLVFLNGQSTTTFPFYFSSFQASIQFSNKYCMGKKIHLAGVRYWDSNSQPLGHESPLDFWQPRFDLPPCRLTNLK